MQGLLSTKDISEEETNKVSGHGIKTHVTGADVHVMSTKGIKVSDIIGKLDKNTAQIVISNGDVSMWNFVEYILKEFGPCGMWVTSWALSEKTARVLCDWLASGKLTSLSAVLDYRSKNHHAAAYHLAKMNFSKVRTERCHAKVTVLRNENINISIIGSSNLTENPRIEANTLIESVSVAEENVKWINKVIEHGYNLE